MTINWVVSEGNLFLLHTAENGTRCPLAVFEEEVNDLEDATDLVRENQTEILELCEKFNLNPAELGLHNISVQL